MFFKKNKVLSHSKSIFDPLRKREVPLTREENVRQWFIGVLNKELGVPMHLMMSEVEIEYGQAPKKFRADIVVYDRDGKVLAIVECKRPDVKLSGVTLEQALRYDMVLDARHYLLTNGNETYYYRREGDTIRSFNCVPRYDELCQL